MPTTESRPRQATNLSPALQSALVIAHPGHELRVHGWLEKVRPHVFVLTDGSGGAGIPRLDVTRRLIERAGARPGGLFGRFPDRALYQAILEGDFAPFTAIVDELSSDFDREHIALVAGDATEGYNPAHDVCRLLIDATAIVVSSRRSEPLVNLAFPLTGLPTAVPPGCAAEPLRLVLDSDAFERKLQAAREYAPLHLEVEAAFGDSGREAFQVECLFPALPNHQPEEVPEDGPFYERYGEKQVAAGRYWHVLRYRQHFLPLKRALQRHVIRLLSPHKPRDERWSSKGEQSVGTADDPTDARNDSGEESKLGHEFTLENGQAP